MAEMGEFRSDYEPKDDEPYLAVYEVASICTGGVDENDLATRIYDTIAPRSWRPDTASIEGREDRLVVWQSRAVHEQIREFLERQGLKEKGLNPIPAEHFTSIRIEEIIVPDGGPFPEKLELIRPVALTGENVRAMPGARLFLSTERTDRLDAEAAKALRATDCPLLVVSALGRLVDLAREAGRESEVSALESIAERWKLCGPWVEYIIWLVQWP